jgi:tripartite-type tricarboxylate transporter receptor subunit TctC
MISGAAAAVAAPALLRSAYAQDAAASYPSGTVKMIVPVGAGGVAHAYGMLLAEHFKRRWNQPVIVVNMPGGGGVIAAREVARSKPDGLNLLAASRGSLTIAPHLKTTSGYDSAKDLKLVSMTRTAPFLLMVRQDSPWKELKDLIADAKKRPGVITYSSIGVGSMQHVLGEILCDQAGIKLVHVPYDGEAGYSVDLIGGRLDVATGGPSTVAKHKGQIRAIVTATAERSALTPDVPCAPEAGLPNWLLPSWGALVCQGQTPQAIVDKIDATMADISKDPEYTSKLAALELDNFYKSGREYEPQLQKELAEMLPVLKRIGVAVKG